MDRLGLGIISKTEQKTMATGSTTNPHSTTVEVRENDYDRFILQQIERTQRHVKVTELATLVLALSVGVLGFFLLVTFIDHWMFGLGFWGRLSSLLVLIIGTIAFVATQVVPYVIRSINPVYAAQAIEKSTPNAKNGLINFMLLRNRPGEVRAAVFDAVQKRAAVDLSDVEVGLAVDRTLMIRLGYALAALVAIAGAYKILSPKDPIATVSRVISPWEQIARPSRVQIERVDPGDVTVYRGRTVDISASVLGLSNNDPVTIVYSTEDGQVAGATVAMQPDGGSAYVATLGGSSGMQQHTIYRVQGGDAESIEYRITVREAPSIEVTRIDYDFAKYTEIAAESTNVGDIRAVEGTRITIHADANQPISSAYLELLPGDSAANGETNAAQPYRTLQMKHSGQSATATLMLQLQADRTTPEFAAYRVRFSNEAGEKNDQPAQHHMEVSPDLVPLVDILSPDERDLEVAANRFVDFEVRGVDPDFKLSSLVVEAASSGSTITKTNLIEQNESGQVIRKYRFQPNQLGLKAGTSVLLWAVAADNRHSPQNGQIDPNTARTDNYRIRIVAPEPIDPDLENDDQQQGDSNSNQANDGSEGDESGEGSGGLNSNNNSDGATGESNDQQGTGSASDNNDESNNESDPSDSSSDSSSEGGTSDSPSESDSDPGSEGTTDGSNSNPSDKGGTSSDNNTGNESNSNDGAEPSENGTEEKPVASDGTNDPDAFERILDHMRENGEESDTGSSTDDQKSDTDDSKKSGTEESPKNGSDTSEPNAEKGDSTSGNNAAEKPSDDPKATEDGGEKAGSNGEDSKSDDPERGTGNKSESGDPRSESGNPKDDGDPSNDPQGGSNLDDSSTGKPSDDQRDPSDDTNGDSNDDSASGTEGEPGDDQTKSPAPNKTQQNPADQPGNEGSDNDEPGDSSSTGKPEGSTDDSTDTDANDSNESNSRNADDKSAPSTPEGNPNSTDSQNDSADSAFSGNKAGPDDSGNKGQEIDGPDDPNLEYARKATDMALEYLKDKKDNRELLEKLGWTEEEANAFLKRWQNLQKESAKPDRGNRAKREWNDSLKSLGLKPKNARTRSGADQRRDSGNISSDGGSRSKPPAAYADQFRAYLKESDNAE
jgi:hypothetical protein